MSEITRTIEIVSTLPSTYTSCNIRIRYCKEILYRYTFHFFLNNPFLIKLIWMRYHTSSMYSLYNYIYSLFALPIRFTKESVYYRVNITWFYSWSIDIIYQPIHILVIFNLVHQPFLFWLSSNSIGTLERSESSIDLNREFMWIRCLVLPVKFYRYVTMVLLFCTCTL